MPGASPLGQYRSLFAQVNAFARSVLRRSFCPVDNKHFHRTLCGFQAESQLLLERCEERRAERAIYNLSIRRGRARFRCPAKCKVVPSLQTRVISSVVVGTAPAGAVTITATGKRKIQAATVVISHIH
jgi:hypothetical protein